MPYSSNPSRILISKIKHASWALGLIFLIIIGRLIHLQILQKHTFFTKSRKNFLRIESIPSLRGNILDRNGQLLATNRPTTNLFWEGMGKAKLGDFQLSTLRALETILGKSIIADEHLFDQI